MASRRKGFPLRLPPELLDEVRGWAEQEMRSVNAQIEWILRDALRRHGRGKRADEVRTDDAQTGDERAGDRRHEPVNDDP